MTCLSCKFLHGHAAFCRYRAADVHGNPEREAGDSRIPFQKVRKPLNKHLRALLPAGDCHQERIPAVPGQEESPVRIRQLPERCPLQGADSAGTCRSAAEKVPGEDHGAGCGRNRSPFCVHCGCVPDVLNRHLLEISDVIARVVSASAGDGMLTEVQRILEEGGTFGSAVFRSAMGPDLIEDVRAFFSDYADKVLAPTVTQDPAEASSL